MPCAAIWRSGARLWLAGVRAAMPVHCSLHCCVPTLGCHSAQLPESTTPAQHNRPSLSHLWVSPGRLLHGYDSALGHQSRQEARSAAPAHTHGHLSLLLAACTVQAAGVSLFACLASSSSGLCECLPRNMHPINAHQWDCNVRMVASVTCCMQGDLVWHHCGVLHHPCHRREQGPQMAAGRGAHPLALLGLVDCSHQLLALDVPGRCRHLR